MRPVWGPVRVEKGTEMDLHFEKGWGDVGMKWVWVVGSGLERSARDML